MKSKVQKWGNSLAVRIPKPFAVEMKLVEDSSIQMMVKEGVLVIVPEPEGDWSLEALLSGITPENLHDEWETGGPEGRERW